MIKYGDFVLQELVIGTGGASPDFLTENVENKPIQIYEGYPYEMVLYEYQEAYGYCNFSVGKTRLNANYVKL